MKKSYSIIHTCSCPRWAPALVNSVIQRTNLRVNEVVIWDFTYKRIEMHAEVWDEKEGGWIEKRLTLKYYEDAKNPLCLLLSYSFYDNEEMVHTDTLPDGRISSYRGPTYLDEGTYRIFGYWSCPKCVRISD